MFKFIIIYWQYILFVFAAVCNFSFVDCGGPPSSQTVFGIPVLIVFILREVYNNLNILYKAFYSAIQFKQHLILHFSIFSINRFQEYVHVNKTIHCRINVGKHEFNFDFNGLGE